MKSRNTIENCTFSEKYLSGHVSDYDISKSDV
jgi:hypothetical protein